MTTYHSVGTVAQLSPTVARLRELDTPAKLSLAPQGARQFGRQFQGDTNCLPTVALLIGAQQ